jgi:ADP-ribose pyrophosphatase YjhB (NUDIX family)
MGRRGVILFSGLRESLDEATRRESVERTPLRDVYPKRLSTSGRADRNPRRRVVSTAHFALVPPPPQTPEPGSKYADAACGSLRHLPRLRRGSHRPAALYCFRERTLRRVLLF